MSQTLSLEPGKYSLFITPPVAGVDFTGTPTPSVSYQWRKNGTAIAGQTAATITGVWVEQSGGTVDLVDGDTISIDIILTNTVAVVTKTVSAVIDAAIAAPVISPISIRLVSAPNDSVSSLTNASIGSQIMVASTGSVNVVTTPPVLPTYQWRRGYAPIAGATSQTYTLQAADADAIIDCVVTATNTGGTATRTASVILGTVSSVGWTTLTPSASTRLIYVSNDGDNVAASNVKGRGYYLPSDDEIGADATNPSQPVVAYRTLAAANDAASGSSWIMLRRGDMFTITEYPAIRGSVVAAWGPESDARPVIVPGAPPEFGGSVGATPWVDVVGTDRSWMHLDFDIALRWYSGSGATSPRSGMLFEGCRFRRGLGATNYAWITTVTVRRCIVDGLWKDGDNSALFVDNYWDMPAGDSRNVELLIEECVFDRNGWRENPDDATAWTGNTVVAQDYSNSLPVGQGVQPRRQFRDRNLYLNKYSSSTLRGNIFSRDGGGGSVQQREGGICERCLFIWNEQALDSGHRQALPSRIKSALVKDNVVLHDDCFLPPGGWGIGIAIGGGPDSVAVADSNIVAHFHRYNNGTGALVLEGKEVWAASPVDHPAVQLGTAIVEGNVAYQQHDADGIHVRSTSASNGVLACESSNNEVSTTRMVARADDATKPAAFSNANNQYHSTATNGFVFGGAAGTFAQWQAAGYDTDGTVTTDFAAFKAAAGWTAPERDIVSYMESVDPTYVVNEDVYVDEDATTKQTSRQKVWEVLATSSVWPGPMQEAQAKLAARRFHAFVTFIQRAKENRRGAWDTRWTAEAVSNYIRAGFGKAAVTGAYDTRSLADRLLDYTT